MSSILVTGAAGFIGSNLSQALALRGDRVIGLDNFDPFYAPSFKHRNLSEIQHALSGAPGSFTLVEGDIRDRKLVSDLFELHRFDAIVHLGALAGVRTSIGEALRYFDVNITGTIHLLDMCVAHNVPHVVFASSSSVYGNSDKVPSTEDEPCDRPLAPYPASKRSGELLGYSYHNLHGLSFTALRFFTVYGPRNRPDMMASMLLESVVHGREVTLFGGGQLKRDWTYVADIVKGVTAALDRPLGFEAINLGRGEPVLLREFVEVVEELSGKKAVLRDVPTPAADVRETFASVDKARRLLGYAPSTSVREGLERTWAWYRTTKQ